MRHIIHGGIKMGFNFRKSIKLGKNFRINLSKSGVGFSAGVKGARVSVGPKGVRKTASIPGTGISYTEQKSWNQINKSDQNKGSKESYIPNKSTPTIKKNKKPGCGCFTVIIVLIFIGILHSAFSSNTPKSASNNSTSTTSETKQNTKPNTTDTDNQNKAATPAITPPASTTPSTSTNNSTNNQSQNNTIQPSSQSSNSTIQSQDTSQNSNSDDNTIVYYVPGRNVYHLSRNDTTLRRSKNVQSMTLKEAKAEGMRQSGSKADE